jgi:hypothetical protein
LQPSFKGGSKTLHGPAKSEKVQAATFLCAALLLTLVGLCYFRELKGYFLADDFGEINYVANIWAGHWQNYWLDWISNVQRLPGMAVYRPWFITSLVLDFAIWHSKPFGYLLTDLFYFAADVVFLFFVARQLTSTASVGRSMFASLFSAALFAVNPLHCESVSWSAGRTDTICCTYFLASLWLFLKSKDASDWRVVGASVLCFWLSLLTKEMSIGLPFLVTALAMQMEYGALPNRLRSALKASLPFWASMVVYFVIRWLALGTLGGGYTAQGDDALRSLWTRLSDLSNISRALFPLPIDSFSPNSSFASILTCCYAGLGTLIILRLLRKELSLVVVGIFGLWFFLSWLPIYSVWSLGADLQGERYLFFLTIPLSMLAPFLLLVPRQSFQFAPVLEAKSGDQEISSLASLILVLTVLTYGQICYLNNLDWLHAGKEIEACVRSATKLATSSPSNERISLLGIPKTHHGAHMIYNGATMRMALSPPFMERSYADRFITFDPVFYGREEFIDTAQFKRVLKNGASCPYVWSAEKGGWVQSFRHLANPAVVPLAFSIVPGSQDVVAEESGIRLLVSKINPLAYDFLAFQYRIRTAVPPPYLKFEVRWRGTTALQGNGYGKADVVEQTASDSHQDEWRNLRLPLSSYWRWYACGDIDQIELLLPPVRNIEIRDIKILSDLSLRPSLSILAADGSPSTIDNIGVYQIRQGVSKLMINAQRIAGAKSISIEVTKPNAQFEDNQFGQSNANALFKREICQGAKSELTLDEKILPLEGICQIRVLPLDGEGKPIGEYSEPLTVCLKR